jgi:hypothetical protein
MKLKFKLACLICVFAIPVILSSCKESIDVEEIASPNLSQGIKPSDKEIEDFKNWYSNLESNPNERVGAKDEIDEVQEIELWKRAISHKQEKASNKLMTLPLIDFKEKGKTKVKQLYLTETDGKKGGYKVEINSSNGKSDKFTGTVTIMSLDEKSKREYKYKDNKLESKKNSRIADTELPEVTVTAYVQHNGTWLMVSVLFSPANTMPVLLYASVEPCGDWGCGSINLEWDPNIVLATLEWVREKLLQEAGHTLNPTEMNILRTMSTREIVRFYNNYTNATTQTNLRMTAYGGANDPTGHANAFKHALFAALHVQAFGYNRALQLVTAHENGRGTGCDTEMDMLNNEIGLNIGVGHSGDYYEQLVQYIYEFGRAGHLWTVGGNCIHRVPF